MRGGRLPSWPVKQLLSPQRVRRRVQGLDRHRQRESRSGAAVGKSFTATIGRSREPAHVSVGAAHVPTPTESSILKH